MRKSVRKPRHRANIPGPCSSEAAGTAALTASVFSAQESAAPAATPVDRRGPAWVRRVMQREGPGILRMLWRMLGREQDVLDAYQDCFCKLASLSVRRTPRSGRAYAYRTAANLAVEMIRTRRRRFAHLGFIAAGRGRDVQKRPDCGTSDHIDRLRGAVAKLPAHLRNVVVLRDLSLMSYKEVGRTLGIDPATARVYRRHAVVKLAELMGVEDQI